MDSELEPHEKTISQICQPKIKEKTKKEVKFRQSLKPSTIPNDAELAFLTRFHHNLTSKECSKRLREVFHPSKENKERKDEYNKEMLGCVKEMWEMQANMIKSIVKRRHKNQDQQRKQLF